MSSMKLKSDRYTTGQKALTESDLQKILDAVDCLEDELLIKLAVATGIRREDLMSIRIANINLEDETLTFHESKKNRDRTIPISPSLVQLMKKFYKTIEKRELLFSISGRTAYRRLNRLCRIAGIPERPFHALRATCIKLAQARGWKMEQVASLTGDAIRTIEEHYATPSADEMAATTREKPII